MPDPYSQDSPRRTTVPWSVSVGTSSTRVLGPNPNRRALLLPGTSLNRMTIAFGAPAVLLAGITIQPGNDTVELTWECCGAALCEDVYAIFETAGETYGGVEVT